MKKYLAGFGIIMAIGFAFALIGSNGASDMLATLLNVAVLDTATSTTAATTTVANTSTTTSTTLSTTTANTQAPAPLVIRTAMLSGLALGQEISGTFVFDVIANNSPTGATFIMTNTQTNDVVKTFTAGCTVDTTNAAYGTCKRTVDTLTIPNGSYSIVARVAYSDGVNIASNQIPVVINNIVKPLFKFSSLPIYVSGKVTIGGEITDANAIEFLYVPAEGAQPIRIGNAIFAGGFTIQKWIYEWDTAAVPNGSYKVIAMAKNYFNNGEAYNAGEVTINMYNAGSTVSAPTTTISGTETQGASSASGSTTTTSGAAVISPPIVAAPSTDEQPDTVLGKFLDQVKMETKKTATQNKEQPVPTAPIVQQIQDISVGLLGGERDSADAMRKLATLQKELWKGVNPASPAIQAKTQYQSPKVYGTTIDTSVMRVLDVSLSTSTVDTIVSMATTTVKGEQVLVKEKKKIVKERLKLIGKALPNMYVTVYVYSEVPTIAVVKSDRNGNWVYELDNKLADGQHEAYVTINDNTGRVIAKSNRFAFVKTAQAVTTENVGLENVQAASDEPVQPVQAAKKTYALVVFMLIGAGLLVGIFLVLRSFANKKQDLA